MNTSTGRVAIVTGAAGGIGAATAHRLAADGAHVVATDIDAQKLEDLDLAPQHLIFPTDLTEPEAVSNLVERTLDTFGRIDVLVANAGVWQQRHFLDLDVAEWDRVLDVNLRGSFLVCHRVSKAMAASGRPGAIVITASTNGQVAEAETAHYNASKGALIALAKSMAIDLAPYGIRVNAIAPGTIRTPLNEAVLDSSAALSFAMPPAGRWGTAEECASAIAYLASEGASYITGTVLVVDGGQTALNGPPATETRPREDA
jgi:NAD(P)-dependent dehydrogenase (short-subunit alcohol dehydrogenase family)